MKRRTALFTITAIGTGLAATIGGWKWYSIHKTPDVDFLDKNSGLVHELSGVIIPATETPGAKEAMVYEAMIKMVKAADRATQNNFIDGLKEVKEYTHIQFSKPFHQLTEIEKYKVVKYFATKGKNYSGIIGKAKNRFLGKSFFHILKEYTTIAFCTSQKGATEALAYDYIPGEFRGCITLQQGQHSWATK